MNQVILIGRITKDIELKTANGGKSYTQFSLAVSRAFKDANGERQVDFINCVAFDKTAETIYNYTGKGSKLCIVGELRVNNYQDNNGSNRQSINVQVSRIELIDSKNQQNVQNNQNDNAFPETQTYGSELPF